MPDKPLEERCIWYKSRSITEGVMYTACHKLCDGYSNKNCEFYLTKEQHKKMKDEYAKRNKV